jgi:hypothetical protein
MDIQVGGVAILETPAAAVAHGAVTQIQDGVVVVVETTTGQLPPTPSIAIAVLARRLPRAGDIVAGAKTTIITIQAAQDLHGMMEEVTIPVGG